MVQPNFSTPTANAHLMGVDKPCCGGGAPAKIPKLIVVLATLDQPPFLHLSVALPICKPSASAPVLIKSVPL